MNVLILNSSGRSHGNTAVALGEYARELEKNGCAVEIVNLAQKRIGVCRGCRLCFDKGEGHCPHGDDLSSIAERIAAAQVVVFGSPIYVEDINGVLKNWIDRMAYVCHRPAFYGKYSYVVYTSGMGASGHGIRTVERAAQTWGFRGIGSARFVAGAKIDETEFRARYGKKVADEALAIVARASRARSPAFVSLVYFKAQQATYLRKIDPLSYDYGYWAEKGWLDGGRVYYSEARVSRVKALLASLLVKGILTFLLR